MYWSRSVCCTHSWTVCMHRASRHGNPLPFALEDIIMSVGNQYQVTTQDWFSQKKNHEEERDPHVVFNILDAMLKDSLERLKRMRSAFHFCQHCNSIFKSFIMSISVRLHGIERETLLLFLFLVPSTLVNTAHWKVHLKLHESYQTISSTFFCILLSLDDYNIFLHCFLCCFVSALDGFEKGRKTIVGAV